MIKTTCKYDMRFIECEDATFCLWRPSVSRVRVIWRVGGTWYLAVDRVDVRLK